MAEKICGGLYILAIKSPKMKDLAQPADRPVPLKAMELNIAIKQVLGVVTVKQIYTNSCEHPIEAIYNFPLDGSAAVTGFQADFGDRIIKSVIKPKLTAKADYDNAVASGKTAALMTSAREDMFEMMIGQMAPGMKVEITFTYIQELDNGLGGEILMTIPTTIAHKYDDGKTSKSIAHFLSSMRHTPEKTSAPLTVNVDVQTSSTIQKLGSLSHDMQASINILEGGLKGAMKMSTTMAEFNRDLKLVIEVVNPFEPKVLTEYDPVRNSTAALLSFVPDIAQQVQASTFTLIIDCSGSMAGTRMELAREAALTFLTSIPEGNFLQIYKFGGTFQSCFRTPLAVNDENNALAKNFIDLLQADMGGTELIPVFKKMYSALYYLEKPAQVVVITDGQISNNRDLFTMIKKNNNKFRIFGIGVGATADRTLIKGMARNGRGSSFFTSENEKDKDKIAPLIVKILLQALNPCAQHIKIDWADNLPEVSEHATMAPQDLPPLYFGERWSVSKIWETQENKIGKEVQVVASFPNGLQYSKVVPVHAIAEHHGTELHKLFARKMIQQLEDKKEDDEVERNNVTETQKWIEKISMEFNIISTETSFVAVSDKTIKEGGDKMETIVVPMQKPFYGRSFGYGMDHIDGPAPGCPAPGPARVFGSIAIDGAKKNFMKKMMTPPNSDDEDFMEIEPAPMNVSNPKAVMQLLRAQKADGTYEWDDAFVDLFKPLPALNKFKQLMEKKGVAQKIWFTALVVAFLEEKQSKEEPTWKLSVKRAKNFVTPDMIDAAKQAFNW